MVDFDVAITLAVTTITVVLFVSERFALATVAMVGLAALLLSGVLTAEQAFDGFSNRATVTVGAMFVLSAGLARTGAIDALGRPIAHLLKRRFSTGLLAMMLATAVLSAFVNNTAVVAVFLPLVIQCARDTGISASKLLIPLSFSSMFGGACTTIGTSTNLLVSAMLADHGLDRLGLVELAPLGLVFVALGSVYLLATARRLLPDHRAHANLTEHFSVRDYITDVELTEDSPAVGKTLDEAAVVRELEADVLAVFRDHLEAAMPRSNLRLRAGDVIRLRCPLDKISALRDREAIHLATPDTEEREGRDGETALVEAVVSGRAAFVGRTLGKARLWEAFNAYTLAIRHRGKLSRERLSDVVVRAGDALLLEIDRDQLAELQRSQAFVLVSEPELRQARTERRWVAVAILAAAIIAALGGLAPIVTTATAGALAMVLTGCLRHDEAISSIDWNVMFLLGGILSLGLAMETSGTARLIGEGLVDGVGALGPRAVISAVFLATAVLSAFMSNNGTAVLFVPIALAAAETLDVDPRPLVVAVAFGASTSFATPVGYQTNALVYSAGQYRFNDFVKIGAPLTLLFWVVATFGIPLIWPL